MENRRIDIYIQDLEKIYVDHILRDFFGRGNPPDAYIRFNATFKRVSETEAEASYDHFEIVEAVADENIWYIPLAKINIDQYPALTLIVVKEILGKEKNSKKREKNWKKVENIVREIITQMKLMNFKIKAVTPDNLLPKSALPPWEQIEDHASDRAILELWHVGHTAGEIALKVDRNPRTVTNLISSLRKQYGKDIVPTDEQRKRTYRPKNNDKL